MFCNSCGSKLGDAARFCGQCGAQLGVPPAADSSGHGYALSAKDFEHPSMQKMNQALRGSLMLRKTAEGISQKIGKPWYESTFNSILATEKRYPRIYHVARIAARRLGVQQLPSVYLELDRGYQSATYGSEKDAFVNIGSYLPRFLNDRELLFVLGHEIGHLVCQHALWTTVSMFLVGQQRSNLMAEGIMGYLSNPLKLIEGGVESIVTNWMRVADFTADRAALLTVGSFEIAKRSIFLLHLKSRREMEELDIDEWMNQAESQDQAMTKLSQIMTSATPYLGLRLLELKKFAQSNEYAVLRNKVEEGCGLALEGIFDQNGSLKQLKTPPQTGPAEISVANAKPKDVPAAPSAKKVRMLNGVCPKCRAPFIFRVIALPDKPWLDIRCKKCSGIFRLKLDAVRKHAAGIEGIQPDEAD